MSVVSGLLLRTFPMSVSLYLLKNLFCSNTELCPVFWRGHFPRWNIPTAYQRICFVETFTCFVSVVFGLSQEDIFLSFLSLYLLKNLFQWNIELFCAHDVIFFCWGHFPGFLPHAKLWQCKGYFSISSRTSSGVVTVHIWWWMGRISTWLGTRPPFASAR